MLRKGRILLIAWSGMLLACDRPDLPEVLAERGFGDPKKPLAIVLAGTPFEGAGYRITLKGTDRVAPTNTRWVFADSRPVWKCFNGTKTHRFDRGMYSASMASLVLGDEPPLEGNRITLQPQPGAATIQGHPEGGEWSFDPAAVRRLVSLLNETAPTEIGVPILMGHEGKYAGADPSAGLAASLSEGVAGWEGIQTTFKTRYPHLEGKPLDVPKGFALAIAAWLPPRDRRDMLTYGNARLAGTTLKWELRLHERGDEKEPGFRPAVVGFFSPPSPVEAVEIWLDGGMALKLDARAEATPTILHLTKREAWEEAKAKGSFRPAGLAADGFIHGMTPAQLTWVVRMYFKGQHGLVLLHIDPARLKSPLRWERPPGSAERFPHIYGPLNLDAIIKVDPFEPAAGAGG